MARKRERLEEDPAPKKYRYANRKTRSRCDADTIEEIAITISEGGTLTSIARKMAIHPSTLTEWKRRGESFMRTGVPENWEIYGQFLIAIGCASGDYDLWLTSRMHKSKDWFRFYKISERRLPAVYGANPQGDHDEVYNPDDKFL